MSSAARKIYIRPEFHVRGYISFRRQGAADTRTRIETHGEGNKKKIGETRIIASFFFNMSGYIRVLGKKNEKSFRGESDDEDGAGFALYIINLLINDSILFTRRSRARILYVLYVRAILSLNRGGRATLYRDGLVYRRAFIKSR